MEGAVAIESINRIDFDVFLIEEMVQDFVAAMESGEVESGLTDPVGGAVYELGFGDG